MWSSIILQLISLFKIEHTKPHSNRNNIFLYSTCELAMEVTDQVTSGIISKDFSDR